MAFVSPDKNIRKEMEEKLSKREVDTFMEKLFNLSFGDLLNQNHKINGTINLSYESKNPEEFQVSYIPYNNFETTLSKRIKIK